MDIENDKYYACQHTPTKKWLKMLKAGLITCDCQLVENLDSASMYRDIFGLKLDLKNACIFDKLFYYKNHKEEFSFFSFKHKLQLIDEVI